MPEIKENIDHLTGSQKKILEKIVDLGSAYQTELWKESDYTPQTVSKALSTLEEENLIERNQATRNGSSTNLVEPTVDINKNLDYSLLMAGDLMPPWIGEDEVDAQSEGFAAWLRELEREYAQQEES